MNFHGRILIGMVFQFVDINLNGIDIIPDVIGFLIAVFAFSKVQVPYATMGMYCAVLLTVQAFFEIFQPKAQGLSILEPTSLWLQLMMSVMGLLYIVFLACIFNVSKELVHAKKSIFLKLFIGMHILTLLLISVGIHLNINEVDDYLPIWFGIYFLFYLYFCGFLWRREYIELELQKKNKQPLPSDLL